MDVKESELFNKLHCSFLKDVKECDKRYKGSKAKLNPTKKRLIITKTKRSDKSTGYLHAEFNANVTV